MKSTKFAWSALFCLLLAVQVHAQNETDADDDADRSVVDLDSVVVTSQLREQSIQDVPLTVTAYDSEELRAMGTEDINDLGRFTVGLETNNQTVTQPTYRIRGVGTNDFGLGADPTVGVYIDGVYVGRTGAGQLNFNDVERVEVIKGPQGTLFGRNAAAGAFQVITKKPHAGTEANFRATFGNYSLRQFEGLYNTDLSDSVFFRASFVKTDRDGWIPTDIFRDLDSKDNLAFRLGLNFQVSEDTEVLWQADYDELDQDGPIIASTNASIAPADPFGQHNSDFLPDENRDVFGTSVVVNSRFNDVLFKSITAYREFESNNLQNDDGSSNDRFVFASNNIEDQEQFSQEFRFISDNGSRLQWTAGLSFFKEDGNQTTEVYANTNSIDTFFLVDAGVPGEAVPGVPPGSGLAGFFLAAFAPQLEQLSLATGQSVEELAFGIAQANLNREWIEATSNTLESTSYSIYGDFDYTINDRWNFIFGLRYSRDQKDFTVFSEYMNQFIIPVPGVDPVPFGLVFFDQFSPAFNQDDSWTALTPRLVLQYRPNNDVMWFASASQGYKAGGFNTLGVDPAFDEETISNFEVGMKSTLLDGRLRFNATAFHYDYDDLQILKLSGPPGVIPTYNVRNADAEGDGIELEVNWFASDNFYLGGSYGLLDTEYTNYNIFPGEDASDDLTGQPLTGTPKHSLNLNWMYSWDLGNRGGLSLRGDHNYVSERQDSTASGFGFTIDSYTLTNFRLSWNDPSYRWEVALFADNAFDEEYLLDIGGQAVALGSITTRRGDPRFYGIEVSYTWD